MVPGARGCSQCCESIEYVEFEHWRCTREHQNARDEEDGDMVLLAAGMTARGTRPAFYLRKGGGRITGPFPRFADKSWHFRANARELQS